MKARCGWSANRRRASQEKGGVVGSEQGIGGGGELGPAQCIYRERGLNDWWFGTPGTGSRRYLQGTGILIVLA